MVTFSRFVHTFNVDEHVALWHSLRMKPVFISREVYSDLLKGKCNDDLIKDLTEKKILISYKGEDDEILSWLRSQAPQPAIGLCYFILSERCNLACKYCFLGNNSSRRELFSSKDMTKEVADKALQFFVKQLELSGDDFIENESQIVFFGGEPLINFEVLEYIANKVINMRSTVPVLANTEMTVITNGTLLSREYIVKLRDLGVTVNISIDGLTREANKMRVDASGAEVYKRLISTLNLCRELNITPSLSVSLTPATIKDLSGMIQLVKEYGISGLGYNILLNSDNYKLPNGYYDEASQFILDSFGLLRPMGVYEDRIMRKLNAFTSSEIYFSDCGATSGGQVVFSPDGRVGICHELLAEKENFVTTVDDDHFDARQHPLWQKWSSYIPLKNDDCIDCEALGICGGGCPVNARATNPTKGLSCIDERSCIHTKQTLRFLINDLYNVVVQNVASEEK